MNIETIAIIVAFTTALYAIAYGAYDLMKEN
jgi:hypothetical protein